MIIGRFPETSPEHLQLIERVYAEIQGPRLLVDTAAAELIKNVSNAFLALKLSFVNEVAALSEEYGVEVDEVLSGIALDPRIGSSYMRPGLGFGGSCLPKELQVLASAGRRRGIPMHVARATAGEPRAAGPVVRRILAELPASGGRVGLLGLSFKADTGRSPPHARDLRRAAAARRGPRGRRAPTQPSGPTVRSRRRPDSRPSRRPPKRSPTPTPSSSRRSGRRSPSYPSRHSAERCEAGSCSTDAA